MENESNRLKPESEWIIADGKQPAIISEELFAAAQKRFQTEYSPKYRKPSVAVTHWLGGLLKCSACGCTLSTSKQTDKRYGRTYFHFQCCGYLKGTCSVSHSISEKKIVPHILEALNKVLDTHTMTFEIPDQTLPDTQSEQTLLQHALEKLNQKEARIKQAYRDGIDTIEEYKEQKELLQQERDTLCQQLTALTENQMTTAASNRQNVSKVSSVCEFLMDDTIAMAQKNEALKGIVEKIVFHKAENSIRLFFYSNSNL